MTFLLRERFDAQAEVAALLDRVRRPRAVATATDRLRDFRERPTPKTVEEENSYILMLETQIL